MRAWLLTVLLTIAAGLVVRGVALINDPAAWIVAGVLLAGLASLVLVEA